VARSTRRARATITRRLCTLAGFYRYAVKEELLDHSPAAHARRPRLDYESHATGLDRNEMGALLVAAELGPPPIMRSRLARGEVLTPATLQRIRTTLRAALNGVVREGLIGGNAARHVELPCPRRPIRWSGPRVA
jgi:hypothetical protein